MTTKKHIILIEPHEGNPYYLKIYSDLSKEDIGGVDGVVSVSDIALQYLGTLLAVIDKRYDVAEIIEDITNLAMERERAKNA